MGEKTWAEKEFSMVNLGDKRLDKKIIISAEQFLKVPEGSINQAGRGWAEVKSFYRFFQNESFSQDDIRESHIKMTKKRCEEHSIVLAIQDTSYFTYSNHPKTTGLGILTKSIRQDKTVTYTKGLIAHTTFTVNTSGLPLGILDQNIYSRPDKADDSDTEKTKKVNHDKKVIEEKESMRWLNSLKNTHNILKDTSTKVVTICDREADIYDFFDLAQNLKSPVLIRARHNRVINKKKCTPEITAKNLWDFVKSNDAKGEIEIEIPKRKDSPARTAVCKIRFCEEYKLHPPRKHPKLNKNLSPELTLNVISVTEENAPEGIEPIDWMLFTNMPVNNIEEALEKINWYSLRWRIEVFHKILKSGLKTEDCRLSTAERLMRYLALMSIVAWRIYWITLISRSIPNASCLLFLNELEWKVLFLRINKKKKVPEEVPTIREAVHWIAQLGGFLARKGDKEPGIIYIWRGLKKFANIYEGFEMATKLMGNS